MRHDLGPQLKAVLSAYVLPILKANWAVDGAGCRDEVTQAVADDLGLQVLGSDNPPGPARRRGVIWSRHIRQALQSIVFGHMPFERRYRIEGAKLRLDALGPRMPWTIAYIHLNPDTSAIDSIVQTTQREPVPGPGRLVWYCHEQEGANWAGISMLRPAYGAWLLKHETWRVHATSIRRFGMGVPQVTAPVGATQGQVQQARDLAGQMRVGDSSGVGLPAGFAFDLKGVTGSVPNAIEFIRYLDQSMAKMVLAQLIELGQTVRGSRSLGETFMDLFRLSIQAVADELAETATSGVEGLAGISTDLVDQNWGEDEPAPRIVCTDAAENPDDLALAIQALVSCNALTPDENLDSFLREKYRLPERAPQSAPPPAPAIPPQPGQAGLPQPGQPPATPQPPQPPVKASAGGRPSFLHRQPTQVEAAAGFDPEAVHYEWTLALGELLSAVKTRVLGGWRADLVDQVQAAVDQGKTDRLARLSVKTADAATLVNDAMAAMARAAAQRMALEAASQGVRIDPAAVKISAPRLKSVASARATMAGSYLAQQASAKALTVTASAGSDAGDRVALVLDSMSDVSLRDQLGAALTMAQNTGRVAVLKAAPASAGQASYVATEILDSNTCQPCKEIDGHVFASLADAEARYPAGGYVDCQGLARCRGTVIANWEGAA